ncbi:MAG: hypothetical protein Q4G28_02555 [Neisseria sp.]|nr:hypothetical protein [Neisseria sp.]
MNKRYLLLLPALCLLMPPLAAAETAAPVQLETVRLAEGGDTLAANGLAIGPRQKSAKSKRPLGQRISDKLEESRRVREHKQRARDEKRREREKQQQERQASEPRG